MGRLRLPGRTCPQASSRLGVSAGSAHSHGGWRCQMGEPGKFMRPKSDRWSEVLHRSYACSVTIHRHAPEADRARGRGARAARFGRHGRRGYASVPHRSPVAHCASARAACWPLGCCGRDAFVHIRRIGCASGVWGGTGASGRGRHAGHVAVGGDHVGGMSAVGTGSPPRRGGRDRSTGHDGPGTARLGGMARPARALAGRGPRRAVVRPRGLGRRTCGTSRGALGADDPPTAIA